MTMLHELKESLRVRWLHCWVVPWSVRLQFYRHVAMLHRHNVNLGECLERFIDRLESRKRVSASRHFRIALNRFNNGDDFAEALHPIIPLSEYAMIHVGVYSERLSVALDQCIRNQQFIRSVRLQLVRELVPMAANLSMAGIMLWVVATRVEPVLTTVIDPQKAQGLIAVVFTLSSVVTSRWMLVVVAALLTALGVIVWALPNWRGRFRLRCEVLPIFSHYRELMGVVWLGQLASLLAAGAREMTAIERTLMFANPWLQERVDAIYLNLSEGLPLPQAMLNAQICDQLFHFPNRDLVCDFEAIHGHPDSHHELSALVEEASAEVIQRILSSVALYGLVATALSVGIMMMIVLATFQIQNSVLESVQQPTL